MTQPRPPHHTRGGQTPSLPRVWAPFPGLVPARRPRKTWRGRLGFALGGRNEPGANKAQAPPSSTPVFHSSPWLPKLIHKVHREQLPLYLFSRAASPRWHRTAGATPSLSPPRAGATSPARGCPAGRRRRWALPPGAAPRWAGRGSGLAFPSFSSLHLRLHLPWRERDGREEALFLCFNFASQSATRKVPLNFSRISCATAASGKQAVCLLADRFFFFFNKMLNREQENNS